MSASAFETRHSVRLKHSKLAPDPGPLLFVRTNTRIRSGRAALTAVGVWQGYSHVSEIVSREAAAITSLWRDLGGYPEQLRIPRGRSFKVIPNRSSTGPGHNNAAARCHVRVWSGWTDFRRAFSLSSPPQSRRKFFMPRRWEPSTTWCNSGASDWIQCGVDSRECYGACWCPVRW
jgi:hypothetical protein